MSVSLYELRGQFNDVLGFEVESEEDAQAMLALLDEVEDSIEEKIYRIGHIIKTLDYECGILREEEKSLAEKRRMRENKVHRLKNYAFEAMKLQGIDKVERPDRTVRIQKNPPALKIVDETAVPAEWWIPQEPKLDTAGLKDWVKTHAAECDYAYLDQTESLRVK